MREGDKRIVRLKEGNPKGRHVVIVDDLVQSGGTLIECQVDNHNKMPSLIICRKEKTRLKQTFFVLLSESFGCSRRDTG